MTEPKPKPLLLDNAEEVIESEPVAEVETQAPDPADKLLPVVARPRPSAVSSPSQIVGQWQHVTAIAEGLWQSQLMPKSLRTPQAIAAVILKGMELDIPPMQAVQSLHVIDGKVGMSAELMRALIYQRCPGSKIIDIESTNERCILEGHRPGQEPKRAEFNAEDAAGQNLLGKDNWKREPTDMYYARATSRLARRLWPDIIMGCYTTEEIQSLGPEPSEAPDADPFAAKAPPRAERKESPKGITKADIAPLWKAYVTKASAFWGGNVSREQLEKRFKAYVASIAGATIETMADWTPDLFAAVKTALARDDDPRPMGERETSQGAI